MQGDRLVLDLDKPRLQALLGYLILHRQAPASRRNLAFTFWPDTSEAQAMTNLRHLMYRLQRAWPESKSCLVVDQSTLWWHPSAAWMCDLVTFEDCIAGAVSSFNEASERLSLARAVDAYGGEFLAGQFDEWIIQVRERLELHYRAALERLIGSIQTAGEYATAIHYAERLLRVDPLNEAAYRWLMHLHSLNGDRAGALYVYHQCNRLLYKELGIQPDSLTQSTYQQILHMGNIQLLPLSAVGSYDPPLIGRSEQWGRLLDCWRGVVSGNLSSQCVLISGEAGIGKSCLVLEFAAFARRQGASVASCECYSGGRELPYAPLAKWLQSFSLENLPDYWLRELSPLVLASTGQRRSGDAVRYDWQRQRLFESLARVTLAQSQPILLILDNAHLADCDTLEWLHYLLHFDLRARLVVLLTHQPGDADLDNPLSRLCAGLQRAGRFTETPLGRLSQTEIGSLSARFMGRHLSEESLHLLYQFSEGNPLFAIEGLRLHGLSLSEDQSIVSYTLEALWKKPPSSFKAIVSLRLAQITPDARHLLEVASVIGRSFRLDVIRLAAQIDEARLVGGLDELWRRQLIREQGENQYDFYHEMLRQVVYQDLSRARRRHLHRIVAQALRQVNVDNLDQVCVELASHYEIIGQHSEAAEFFRQAFQVSQHRYSNEEAIAYSNRALDHLHSLLDRAETESSRRECLRRQAEIMFERDWTWRLLGRVSGLEQDIKALILISDALQDVEIAARTHRLQASLDYRFCRWAEARQAAELAIALGQQAGNRREQGYSYQTLGRVLRAQGEYTAAQAALEESRTIFREIGNPIEEVHSLSYLSTMHLMRQDFRAAFSTAEEALAYCELNNLNPQRRFALADLGAAAVALGELDRAAIWLDESLALAREFHDLTQEVFCLLQLGWLWLQQGQARPALESFQTAYEMALRSELNNYQSCILVGLSQAHALHGDILAAIACGELALQLAQKFNLPLEISISKRALDELNARNQKSSSFLPVP